MVVGGRRVAAHPFGDDAQVAQRAPGAAHVAEPLEQRVRTRVPVGSRRMVADAPGGRAEVAEYAGLTVLVAGSPEQGQGAAQVSDGELLPPQPDQHATGAV